MINYLSSRIEDSPLFDEMFRHRADQFVSRLKWSVDVDDAGRERDQFDDAASLYLIAEDEQHHVASMRFRTMLAPTLISEAFPQFQEYCEVEGCSEVTRFCAAPGVRFDGRAFFKEAWELGRSLDVRRFYALFTPPMPRIYRSMGWAPRVLAREGDILLGTWDVESDSPVDRPEKRC